MASSAADARSTNSDASITPSKNVSQVSMVAMGGSALGLLAMLVNKTVLWKLMALLFFLWGPASLCLSGIVHVPMILGSDTCQDIEEVAIDVLLAQRPELDHGGTM